MASLSLKHISKIYDGTTLAVKDFNMDIRDREFIVFVGPSGCGKSTTLRMIAGLEDISAGELSIGGTVVNDLEPRDRGIAMVFQNYALYPHMTVYENMAFSLRTAKEKKEVIHKKVMEAAEALGITEYLSRKPKALSGGQRQRVALGRAIVREPKVFLFDEPLSNLDAKLRASMRAEIIRLWERLGTTFIYVTHDQVEAMTMGSRIVVMKDGVVRQIDTPARLYRHPADLFVAGFIGTPRMNILPVTLTREEGSETVTLHITGTPHTLHVPFAHLDRLPARYMPPAARGEEAPSLLLGIRPEDLRPLPADAAPAAGKTLPLRVTVVENLGGESLVYATMEGDSTASAKGDSTATRGTTDMIFKTGADCTLSRGDTATVILDLNRLHIFDAGSEKSLLPPVPTEICLPCILSSDTLTVAGHSLPLPPALQDDQRATVTEELILPSDALRMEKGASPASFPVTLLSVEDLSDTSAAPSEAEQNDTQNKKGEGCQAPRLCRCTLGSHVLYVVASLPAGTKPGDTLSLVPDLSRLAVPHAGITPPLTENRLPGRIARREKRLVRAGAPAFALEIADQTITADPDLLARLFAVRGTSILRADLLLSLPLDAVGAELRQTSGETSDSHASISREMEVAADFNGGDAAGIGNPTATIESWAMRAAEGGESREIPASTTSLNTLPARVEAVLDYSPGPVLLRLTVGAGHKLLCRMTGGGDIRAGDHVDLRLDTARLSVLDRATEPPTVIV